jgi:hypothetical protein
MFAGVCPTGVHGYKPCDAQKPGGGVVVVVVGRGVVVVVDVVVVVVAAAQALNWQSPLQHWLSPAQVSPSGRQPTG